MKKLLLFLILLLPVATFAASDNAKMGAGIGAGVAVIGAGLGIGLLCKGALEGMARNPGEEVITDDAGKITERKFHIAELLRTNMITGAALVEGVAFFAIVVCLLIVFL